MWFKDDDDPAYPSQENRFLAAFKLTCRKCGSENVTVYIEEVIDCGGETGTSGGWIDFGCADCKQNDFMINP